MAMQNGTTWELPFSQPAVLELQSDFGQLTLRPIEPGETPRIELQRGSAETIAVHIEKSGERVRVSLEPHRSLAWFGHWDCKATVFVPRDVRASVQTNAGSVHVQDLDRCELGIKANAGKIELRNIYGLMHLAADAGSIVGRELGGFFQVETQAGSVRLEILDLQPGEHHVRAAMGSVRLELARGMDMCIETHTSLGSVRNGYPSNGSSPTRLVLSSEMGSIRIEEGAPYRGPRPVPSSSPSPAAAEPKDDPELERILEMVERGKLSATEADDLLRAMGRV